jgi:large subunit ribosomal protein L2
MEKNQITEKKLNYLGSLIRQLKKKNLLKFKIKGISKQSGRNNTGKITAYHRGGGHKRKYRSINFIRSTRSKGVICSIEYDPNRSAFIASVYDQDKNNFFYILAPKRISVGDVVESGADAEPKLGNSLPVGCIPVGSYIHNVSTSTSQKSFQISKSAGTFSKLAEKARNNSVIELSSGEQRLVSSDCYATIGIVSNEFKFLKKNYKAGQTRWLNKRPTVRGVAMNPIDHPHGGGEGKKSGLNKTPWGKYNNRGATSKSKNKCVIKNKNEQI